MRLRSTSGGILEAVIAETPVAVVDLETTGFRPGPDRVVEIAIVRLEPGQQPYLAFDSLLNPQRWVAASHVHGIRNADVVDAPTFEEAALAIGAALSGAVVASYNINFDISFLKYELCMAGLFPIPPHLCLMYARPLLGLGRQTTLKNACALHGVPLANAHQAAADAFAAAQLWPRYREECDRRGVRTFADLAARGKHEFLASFAREMLSYSLPAKPVRRKSRACVT